MSFKFGDILRYPDDQGVGDEILLMHLRWATNGADTYQEVLVLRTTADDDVWATGDILVAGVDELILHEPAPGFDCWTTEPFFDPSTLDLSDLDDGTVVTVYAPAGAGVVYRGLVEFGRVR